MNFANTRFYTVMGIRQAGNIWQKRMDEVSYHKINELIMDTGVPTVQINHSWKSIKITSWPQTLKMAVAEGVRTLSVRARNLCL